MAVTSSTSWQRQIVPRTPWPNTQKYKPPRSPRRRLSTYKPRRKPSAPQNAPDIRRTIITSGGDLYGDTKRVRTLAGVRSTRAAYGPQSASGSDKPPPSGGPRYSHSTGRDDKGRTVTSYTNSKGKKISFRVDGRGRTTML